MPDEPSDDYELVSVEHLMHDLASLGATYEVRGRVLIPTGERAAYTAEITALVQSRRAEIIAHLKGVSVDDIAAPAAPENPSLAAQWGGTRMDLDRKNPWYWEKQSDGTVKFFGPVFSAPLDTESVITPDGHRVDRLARPEQCGACGHTDFWFDGSLHMNENGQHKYGRWFCQSCDPQPPLPSFIRIMSAEERENFHMSPVKQKVVKKDNTKRQRGENDRR